MDRGRWRLSRRQLVRNAAIGGLGLAGDERAAWLYGENLTVHFSN